LTRIEVRLFAALRERAGHGRTTVEIASGGGIDEVWAALALGEEPPGLAVAVNRSYADRTTPLADGDEVAFIPPVSGGAVPTSVAITDRPLDVGSVIASVADEGAGAIASFVGVVRATGRFGPGVTHLHYEVYEEMCRTEIERACAQAAANDDLRSIAVSHRSGLCALGEPTVAIAVSSPHREAAFTACRFLIEELKRSAPIWKKEQYVDGAEWVGQGS
jgi:molybdopterin converting factor subunit 1